MKDRRDQNLGQSEDKSRTNMVQDKIKFAKYLGLYMTQFQEKSLGELHKRPGIDIFWPFKFVWYILTSIWGDIFAKRR